MTSRSNNASGGTNGVTITAGNTGGFSGVAADSVTTTGTAIFDNSKTLHYGLSYQFATGGSAAQAIFFWTSVGSFARAFGRLYVNPSGFTTVPSLMRLRGGGTQTCRISLDSTGHVQLRDSGNLVKGTSTNALTASSWARIEWDITVGASATGIVYIYLTPDAPVGAHTEALTVSAQNFGTVNVDEYSFGVIASTTNATAFNLADLNANDVGLPGPTPFWLPGMVAPRHRTVFYLCPRRRPALPVQDQPPAPTPTHPRPRPAVVRRTRPMAPVPAQATVANPVFPFGEIVQPRRLRGALARRGQYRVPVPPQFNPPYPWAETVQPRRLRGTLARRGRQAWPVPPQDWPVTEVVQARRARGWPVRRGRHVTPTPPQFNPPFLWAEIVQPRRLRGLLPRRGRSFTVVPPQFTPPYPFAAVVQPRRVRGLLLRRGHQWQPTAPQDVLPADVAQPRRPRGVFIRRARRTETVPPQFNPLFLFPEITQARRVRGWPVRRGRIATPVPPQFNPPFPFVEVAQPRRVRGLLARRGRQAQPVPVQQTVPVSVWLPQPSRARVKWLATRRRTVGSSPPMVPDSPLVVFLGQVRRRLRGLLRRGGRPVNVVPPQFNPPYPFAEIVQPRRARALLARRGRAVSPVPSQDLVVPGTGRTRARLGRPARVRVAQSAAAQQVTPIAVCVIRPRPTRGWRRRVTVTSALVPAQAVPVAVGRHWRTPVPRRSTARVWFTPLGQAVPALATGLLDIEITNVGRGDDLSAASLGATVTGSGTDSTVTAVKVMTSVNGARQITTIRG